jgi:uncharacterized protein (TIGR02145 family)
MKNVYTAVAVFIGTTVFGQIEQNINKTSGTVSNPIAEIDSIRFNAGQTEMEVVFTNGNVESHIIADIDDVTFSGEVVGEITALDCAGATVNGTLVDGVTASGVSVEIDYTGGNGGPYNGQIVSSTGVSGLTAELTAGNFSTGTGTLTYEITGTPNSDGTASFELEIGGETCTLEVIVDSADPYPPNTVHCGDPTDIVEVTNPTTGKTWMDRNLGASQVATSSADNNSYGDLYQWGRGADGHQCRTSPTTSTLSSTDQPGHGDFITSNIGANSDWRSPQNTNLWQGVNGTNNPCPSGYRLPTETELNNERLSWVQAPISSTNNAAGAFASPLKLPMAGRRISSDGSLDLVGIVGRYWSSTVSSTNSRLLIFSSGHADMYTFHRAGGRSVRCIKD